MRPAFAVLAVALVAAAGTGCSSDKTSDSASATTPAAQTTAAEATTEAAATTEARPEAREDQGRWARQVDSACRPWQGKIDAVAPPADAADLERWLGETLPLVRKQVAAVAAVKPPAKTSEAERAALFVAGLRKVERGLTRYRAALGNGDAEAVSQALAEANAAGTETRGYALSLAVTQCGGYSSG